MILYLDTSSILKLYLEEIGADQVQAAVGRATRVTTSILAYAEARAAFARARRLRSIPTAAYKSALTAFEDHWESFMRIAVTTDVVRTAGALAELHDLRGYDAVHLASALFAQRESKAQVQFSSFDSDLMSAASREGLRAAH